MARRKTKTKPHPWWRGEPTKRGGIILPSTRKRGKQTIQGDSGPIAVFVAAKFRGRR